MLELSLSSLTDALLHERCCCANALELFSLCRSPRPQIKKQSNAYQLRFAQLFHVFVLLSITSITSWESALRAPRTCRICTCTSTFSNTFWRDIYIRSRQNRPQNPRQNIIPAPLVDQVLARYLYTFAPKPTSKVDYPCTQKDY